MKTLAALAALLLLLPAAARAEDAVDLQWSLCGASPDAVLGRLGADAAEKGKKGVVTYYDANPPVYEALGVSLRTKGKPGELESSVKVRFSGPQSGLPAETDCSWDRYGDAQTYTCEVSDALDGARAAPWTDAQKRFVDAYHRVNWSTLAAFGPYANPKWKLKFLGYKAVFDTVEAGSLHLMELSVKVPRSAADDAYRTVGEGLARRGVVLCPVQEGKTARLFRALGL